MQEFTTILNRHRSNFSNLEYEWIKKYLKPIINHFRRLQIQKQKDPTLITTDLTPALTSDFSQYLSDSSNPIALQKFYPSTDLADSYSFIGANLLGTVITSLGIAGVFILSKGQITAFSITLSLLLSIYLIFSLIMCALSLNSLADYALKIEQLFHNPSFIDLAVDLEKNFEISPDISKNKQIISHPNFFKTISIKQESKIPISYHNPAFRLY